MELSERIGQLDSKITAMHNRLDKHEGEYKEVLKDITKELKELNYWMHRSKGWGAAAVLFATILGGLVGKFLIK